MRTSRRIGLGASLVGLAATGLVSMAGPAHAYTPSLQCDHGPRWVDCFLTYGGANESWYFNGVYYPAGDNQSEVYFRCQLDTQVGIVAYYTGGDGWGEGGQFSLLRPLTSTILRSSLTWLPLGRRSGHVR